MCLPQFQDNASAAGLPFSRHHQHPNTVTSPQTIATRPLQRLSPHPPPLSADNIFCYPRSVIYSLHAPALLTVVPSFIKIASDAHVTIINPWLFLLAFFSLFLLQVNQDLQRACITWERSLIGKKESKCCQWDVKVLGCINGRVESGRYGETRK